MKNLPEHLGGHAGKTHMDNGAIEWIISRFNPKTFLDIGCGPGDLVKYTESLGLESLGIDGDHTLKRYNPNNFIIHDYTIGKCELDRIYDFGWSCEFVEHVYEEFLPNYMHTFQKCKIVMATYAPPGWKGHHHVNCREENYWIQKFSEYDFTYEENLTKELRLNSTMNTRNGKSQRKSFVKNRGLIFKNNSLLGI